MNSQFIPQQQFGAPPQNFGPNRASSSPALPPQGFQNIPLGPPKPGQMHKGSNSGLPGNMPSINTTGSLGNIHPTGSMTVPPTSTYSGGNMGPPPTSMGPPPTSIGPPSTTGPPPNLAQPSSGPSPSMGHQSNNLGPSPPQFAPQNIRSPQLPISSQIPPPDQRPPQNSSFGQINNLKPGEGPPTTLQNGTPVENKSSSPFMNGPGPQSPQLGSLPPSAQQNKPSGPGFPPQSNQPHQGLQPGTGQFNPPTIFTGPPSSTQNQSHRQGPFPIHGPNLQQLPNQQPMPGQQPLHGHPPLPGQQPMPGHPPIPGPQPIPGQPPLPGQPPFPSQQGRFGQQPLPGQPPLPAQMPPNQFTQSSMQGQPPNKFGPGTMNHMYNQPPLPGQPPQFNSPNQLAGQMQGMTVSGTRPYPGAPLKSSVNGDGGPHMPPPLNQQGYMNGQQIRGPQGPGYPPMPGAGPMPAGPGGYPQPNYQQQQAQQKQKLDPDQMPSPIQVTQDDQQRCSGVFATNQKGLVPPLVTTNFIVEDQGNTSPRFIRSTMYTVPISQDIMKQTAMPFSLVISPMARTVEQEYPPPIVNFGELGPVRCIRCKAYMCPFMQFVDSGRRFQCLFCKATTDVPAEYFQHLDHTGQRLDRFERPELVLGTYEFVATADYCRNNVLPKPPAMIFVIDVSYNNVKSGLVNLLCSQMKDIIQNLPVDQGQEKSNMKVGFVTYNSSVHFYNIKGTLAAPQMLIVGDTQEMFMPLLDGFLCTPEESGPIIDALMEQIPAMFGDTRETETVLLPAILAGLEALKASECTGKLLVFHSTLPSAKAPGELKNRDDRKVLGTDKERTVLTPQTQAYNQLGQDCVAAGCSVDLFIFNNAYIDIATIGQVARLTGGEVYKYTYFQADLDGERLVRDIISDLSRPIAFDAIMRVRTSTGVRPTDFYGHFFMSNTTDIELASIDCDKAVAIEIKHDDKLSEEEGVYIQAALLYTSCSGQRRLRIMNLSLKTCSQMADLYRSCDLDTMVNYIAKQSVYKLLDNNPKAVKDTIVNRAAQFLAAYRKNCANPSSAGQLILPESTKLLPLYVNCLLKSDALSGGSDMTIDDRSFVMQAVMTMDIISSVYYFYPRLIPIHDIDPTQEPIKIPAPIRCSLDKMNEQGVYILENGIHMFLWFGLGVNADFIQKVFGAPSSIQVDVDRVGLPELDNPLSIAVRTIIDEIRSQRHRCMRLTVVRQREKLEPVYKHFLVEDRGTDGSPSYVDFLCHMHKEIRTLLS